MNSGMNETRRHAPRPPPLDEIGDNYPMGGGELMPAGVGELIELGGVGLLVAGVFVAVLLRPKTLGAILVFLVAPFGGYRLYSRYMQALAVINGVQPPLEQEPEAGPGRHRQQEDA